jgi:ribulose-phosphate 3-epimerase
MGILPALNSPDFAGVKATLEKIKTFLPEGNFLHCDVADGTMTFNKLWGNAAEWASVHAPYQLEVHLMVEHPERVVEPWIAAGARRVIIHCETINDDSLIKIFDACDPRGVGVALSSNPETTIDRLAPYLKHFQMFQVLSVHPGLAGQPFLPLTLEKIKWLRREYPHAIIEVDGGMNAQTVRMVKDAGADLIVASSYIFGGGTGGGGGTNVGDPKIAYEILKQI